MGTIHLRMRVLIAGVWSQWGMGWGKQTLSWHRRIPPQERKIFHSTLPHTTPLSDPESLAVPVFYFHLQEIRGQAAQQVRPLRPESILIE